MTVQFSPADAADNWKPTLRCAAVIDRNKFAMVFGELEYDDPFSVILIHDGSCDEPWRRVDVQREINAATIVSSSDRSQSARQGYAFLSSEGDVYLSLPELFNEKIPRAGAQSPDALGRGALHALAAAGDELFAAGDGGQVYRRDPSKTWTEINAYLAAIDPGTDTGFSALHVFPDGSLLSVGAVYRKTEAYDITADPAYSDDMDIDALMVLFERQLKEAPNTPSGTALYLHEGTVRDLAPRGVPDIKAICVQGDDVWAVGSDGLILHGGTESEWHRVPLLEPRPAFVSITHFQSRYVVASDYGLHHLDGDRLVDFQPSLADALGTGALTPAMVHAADDVLFCFDYRQGAFRMEDGSWSRIELPTELLHPNV